MLLAQAHAARLPDFPVGLVVLVAIGSRSTLYSQRAFPSRPLLGDGITYIANLLGYHLLVGVEVALRNIP